MSQTETRTRSWTFVVYPESAPSSWREQLDELHVRWVEGPLHDRDLNANGEPKKPHIHVLLLFDGKKSFDQIRELTDALGQPIPQRCHDARALVRYMAHLDNPEKAQYDPAQIVGHGGADVADMLRPSASERYALIAEMQDWVDTYQVTELMDLMRYARVHRASDWWPLLCDSCTVIMDRYIRSVRMGDEYRRRPEAARGDE